MPSGTRYKAVVSAPLTGRERQWIHDLPPDNLVGGVLMCVAEICSLRDEVRLLRERLAKEGLKVPARDEVPDDAERQRMEAETAGIVDRVLTELFRSRQGWTGVDPRVAEFFPQPEKPSQDGDRGHRSA